MTENLSDTISRQYTEYRRMYAQIVYDLLRIAEISNDLHFNDNHMIIVDEVQAYFAEDGVQITFDDPYGDGDNDTQFITIAAPYTPSAVATVVQGILHLLNTGCAPSTSDTPCCCGKPMQVTEVGVWQLHETVTYRCDTCRRGITRIEIVEGDDLDTPRGDLR